MRGYPVASVRERRRERHRVKALLAVFVRRGTLPEVAYLILVRRMRR